MKPEVYEVGDVERLSRQAAELLMDHGREAVTEKGRYIIALTGGNTVGPLYSYMAELEHQMEEESAWGNTYFFWGDERFVAPDHPESNSAMASRLFLGPSEVKESNIFKIPTDFPDVQAGAAVYEKTLRAFFKDGPMTDGFPVFDLVLLGMGPDGHIASLFPETDAIHENERWVTTSFPPILKPAVDRITLTLPVINRARLIIFLISGSEKREIADKILTDPGKYADEYPAALIRPQEGRVAWVIAKD